LGACPSGVPPNYPLDQNQDNENDMSTELRNLRDKVAELEEEIEYMGRTQRKKSRVELADREILRDPAA